MSSDQFTRNGETLKDNADNNIVSLHRFADGRGVTPLRQAEAYWSALRHGSAVPKRSQIDPRGLENILEYAFILDRIAPGVARIRLAGQHLNQLAGMEVRGMPLSTFFSPSGREHLSAALEYVFDAPAVVELALQGKPALGRKAPEARMILLPLQGGNGQINRAMGVLVADDPKAHTKLSLSVVDTVLRPASGFQKTETPKNVAGFAGTNEPEARPVAHLRLV